MGVQLLGNKCNTFFETFTNKWIDKVDEVYYRCPICEFVVKGSLNMARHLTDRHKLSVKDEEILDSYILVQEGFVGLKGDIQTGDTQPLMKLIEKK